MLPPEVPFESPFGHEPKAADMALVRLVARVGLHMDCEVPLLGAPVGAEGAPERLLSRVDADVLLQLGVTVHLVAAIGTAGDAYFGKGTFVNGGHQHFMAMVGLRVRCGPKREVIGRGNGL